MKLDETTQIGLPAGLYDTPTTVSEENKTSEGIIHEEQVAQELNYLRVRDEARELYAREKAETVIVPAPAALTEWEKLPPLSYRIGKIIPSKSLVAIIAPNKTGKTTFVLNLIASLVDGRDLLGAYPCAPEPGRVAFLNYEMTPQMVVDWARRLNFDRTRVIAFDMRGHGSALASPWKRQELAQQLKNWGCTSLVVDSFGQAFWGAGRNQNDNTDVNNWYQELKELTTSSSINETYLIVHAGKNTQAGARGSSAIEDVPDVNIFLDMKDRQNPQSERFIYSRGRAQDIPKTEIMFDTATGALSLGELVGTRKKDTSDYENQVMRFIAEREDKIKYDKTRRGLPGEIIPEQDAPCLNDIVESVKLGKGTLCKVLNALVDAGTLRKKKQGRRIIYWRPFDTPLGARHLLDLENTQNPISQNGQKEH